MDVLDVAKPLPTHLIERYRGWRATKFSENESWYTHLAEHGQNPRMMMIACCDSRLHVTSLFGADSGEIFIHRNIANFVPPFQDDGGLHGTSAAIEYAVNALEVANLIVVGHSNCGGVAGAHSLCEKGELMDNIFLKPWLELLRPGYDAIQGKKGEETEKLKAMEQQSVVVSLKNLLSFPFVKKAVEERRLALHGLWHDIGAGQLYQFDAVTGGFEPL